MRRNSITSVSSSKSSSLPHGSSLTRDLSTDNLLQVDNKFIKKPTKPKTHHNVNLGNHSYNLSTESIGNQSVSSSSSFSNNSSYHSKGGTYYFPNGEVFRPRTTPTTSKRKNRPTKIITDQSIKYPPQDPPMSLNQSPISNLPRSSSSSSLNFTRSNNNNYQRKQSLTKSIRNYSNDTPTNITVQEPNHNALNRHLKSQNTTTTEQFSNWSSSNSSSLSSTSSSSNVNHHKLELTTSNTPSTSINEENGKSQIEFKQIGHDRCSKDSNLSLYDTQQDTTDDTVLSTLNETSEETYKSPESGHVLVISMDDLKNVESTESTESTVNGSRVSFESLKTGNDLENELLNDIIPKQRNNKEGSQPEAILLHNNEKDSESFTNSQNDESDSKSELKESHILPQDGDEVLNKFDSSINCNNLIHHELDLSKPVLQQLPSSSSSLVDTYKTPVNTPDQSSFKDEDITPIQHIPSDPSTPRENINAGPFIHEESMTLPDPTISLVESYLKESPESQVVIHSASTTPQVRTQPRYSSLILPSSLPSTPKVSDFVDLDITKSNKFLNDSQKDLPPRGDVMVIDNGQKIRKHHRASSSTSGSAIMYPDSTEARKSVISGSTPPPLPPKSPNMKVKGRRKKRGPKKVESLLLDGDESFKSQLTHEKNGNKPSSSPIKQKVSDIEPPQSKKKTLPKSTSINFFKSFFKKSKSKKDKKELLNPIEVNDKRDSVISEIGSLPDFQPEKSDFLTEMMVTFDEKFENELTPTKITIPNLQNPSNSKKILNEPFLKDDELTSDQIIDQKIKDTKNPTNDDSYLDEENMDYLFPYIDKESIQDEVSITPPLLDPIELSTPLEPILRKNKDTKPVLRKQVSFTNEISVHETFSGELYKRYNKAVTQYSLSDPKEINKIKNEVNMYKCNEMLVHESSQNNTHFYY